MQIFSKKEVVYASIFGLVNYSFSFIPLILLPLYDISNTRNYFIMVGIEYALCFLMYNIVSGAFYYDKEYKILKPVMLIYLIVLGVTITLMTYFNFELKEYLLVMSIMIYGNILWQFADEYKFKHVPNKHVKMSVLYTVTILVTLLLLMSFTKLEIWVILYIMPLPANIVYYFYILGKDSFSVLYKSFKEKIDWNMFLDSLYNELSDTLTETSLEVAKVLFEYKISLASPELFSVYAITLSAVNSSNGASFSIVGLYKGYIKNNRVKSITKGVGESFKYFMVIVLFTYIILVGYLKHLQMFSLGAVIIASVILLYNFIRFSTFIIQPILLYNGKRRFIIQVYTLFSIAVFALRVVGTDLIFVITGELIFNILLVITLLYRYNVCRRLDGFYEIDESVRGKEERRGEQA